MKWISTKDKPIPKEGNVFALSEHGAIGNVYWSNDSKRFLLETFGGLIIGFDQLITHWVAIPEIPNQ